jgi:D-hexose-6-phosphate mutarotase
VQVEELEQAQGSNLLQEEEKRRQAWRTFSSATKEQIQQQMEEQRMEDSQLERRPQGQLQSP